MSHTAGAVTVAVVGRAFKDSGGGLHAALHRVVCSGVESHVSRPLNADCLDFTSAETVPTCRVFVHFNLQRLETCPSRGARHANFCFLACYLSARTNTTLTSIKADVNFTTRVTLKAKPSAKEQIFFLLTSAESRLWLEASCC